MRQEDERGDKRYVGTLSKKVINIFLKYTASWGNFLMALIFFLKMWKGSVKIKWRGAAKRSQWHELKNVAHASTGAMYFWCQGRTFLRN